VPSLEQKYSRSSSAGCFLNATLSHHSSCKKKVWEAVNTIYCILLYVLFHMQFINNGGELSNQIPFFAVLLSVKDPIKVAFSPCILP